MNLPALFTEHKFHKLHHIHELYHMLTQACHALNLVLDKEDLLKLLRYLDALLLWNKAYNLTAITEPKEALIKHIVDCLAIVWHFDRHDKKIQNVLDIGTGAGLPAIVLAIARPEYQVVALDANSKKIRFVRQMIAELALPNMQAVASRIENFSGQFDVITSRAFASLTDFVSLGQPYLADAPKGMLIAMKGRAPIDEELTWLDAQGWQYAVQGLSVPYLPDERCLVCVF